MTAQSDLQSKQQAQQGVFMRKKVMTLLLSLALVASFAACIDDVTTNNDAGQDAATIADAAGADSGQVEADAAIDDAAGSDAATNEDGAILTNDASMNDAGVEDGGLVLGDAGDDPDATTNDAGDEDSGTVEDGGFVEDGGLSKTVDLSKTVVLTRTRGQNPTPASTPTIFILAPTTVCTAKNYGKPTAAKQARF